MSADASSHAYRHAPFSGATFAVLLAVADSVNDQYGNRFWMSVRKLATKARIERRSAQMALAKLVESGWLEVVSAPKGDTKEYRFIFDETRPVVYDGREVGGAESAPPRSTRAIDDTGGANNSTEGAQNLRPIPRVNPREPNSFARFWDSYPLHKSRGAAERAWKNALKKVNGDVDRIVSAVERYAAEVREHDLLIAYPATWLNQERWDDDPLPPKPKLNGHKPEPTPHVSVPFAQRKADEERARAERQRALERLVVE